MGWGKVFAALPFFMVGCGSTAEKEHRESSSKAATSVTSATASSSVSIASSSAPSPYPSGSADAVSGASMRMEGGTRVVTTGSIDGAALRKRHRDRIGKDTSPVTILKGDKPLDLGQRICEAVVPKRPADTPILLKPNLCGFDAMQDAASHAGDNGVRGRTTDPEFVRGVIHCLKARGHTKITIAEGCSLDHAGFEKLVKVSGYADMAASEKVPLVAMDDDGTFDKEGDTPGLPIKVDGLEGTLIPTLLIPKILADTLDHGLFISLPKIKVHRFSVVSLSVKGMQGTVMLSDAAPAHQQKWRMHKELNDYLKVGKNQQPDDRAQYVKALETFADRMSAVLEVSAPDVVLADGAPAEGGDGFQTLVPTGDQVAIGGTNPITVDKVGAQFLGLWNNDKLALGLRGHKTSPLIETAAKSFGVDLEHVSVTGDGATLLDSPRPTHFKAIAPFGVDFNPPIHH